jgi:Domain of unknown function (DUF4388)
MTLTGYLSEYSLAEIFNFVQDGNKSGVLSIDPDCLLDRSLCDRYAISFQGGRIMSIVNGKDRSTHNGLIGMMAQRQWLLPAQIVELEKKLSSLQQPLGIYLKSQQAIDADRLRLIFNSQVISNICKLFVEVHQGHFKFDPKASLAHAEMTGLSLTAKQATVMGLRLLKDWSNLASKLPAPDSTIQRLAAEPIGVTLERQELLVWNLAVGEMSIAKIGRNLGLETIRVQQISFLLIVTGLIKEIPAKPSTLPVERQREIPRSLEPVLAASSNTTPRISNSFLSNLMGFLKRNG